MKGLSLTELTQDIVRELLDYDPVTGKLTWKFRKPSAFSHLGEKAEAYCRRFNANYAGNEAFTASHNYGYRMGKIYAKIYKAHRVIWLWMTGKWPKIVDHQNGDPTDNRWKNLRNVNSEGNAKNLRKAKNNTSGHVNIRSRKNRKTFDVQVRIDGKHKHVGTFKTLEAAIEARNKAWADNGYHPNHCVN